MAVHGVLIKRQHKAPLAAHGIAGYVVLSLLAGQWLLGGGSISLASSSRSIRHDRRSASRHWLVKLHVQTGQILYGLFVLVLILALTRYKTLLQSSTAGLVFLASLLALYGLQNDDDDDEEEAQTIAS